MFIAIVMFAAGAWALCQGDAHKVPGWICIVAACAVLIVGPAAASGSPWKCTLHGAGMKTVCSAK